MFFHIGFKRKVPSVSGYNRFREAMIAAPFHFGKIEDIEELSDEDFSNEAVIPRSEFHDSIISESAQPVQNKNNHGN